MAESSNYAWSSPERALAFAKAMAHVVIRHRPQDTLDECDEAERLKSVLRVLLDFTPVEAASLWKIKARANRASCIADTRPGGVPTDAGFCAPGEAFVCELTRPPVASALQCYREKVDLDGKDWATICASGDRLYIPFGRLCGPPSISDNLPNYLVELYARNAPRSPDLAWNIPDDVIEAMKSKLTSGICALIDRRLTRITREMSQVAPADAAVGADDAIDKAIERVLPQFIRCEQILRLNASSGGNYRTAQYQALLPHGEAEAGQRLTLPEDAKGELVRLVERAFSKEAPQQGSVQTVLLFEEGLRHDLSSPTFERWRNLMVARLNSGTDGSTHSDYLILINRMNDLAAVASRGPEVPDYFDWEDEIYLSHIALVVGFIKEVFAAEEVRVLRAHILAHEMHAPTGFIYATIERILDSVEGRRAMPEAMMRRELHDILLTNELQSALIDNLMLGLEVINQPPNQKYIPVATSLRDTADNIARMVLPICRKYGVSPGGIVMRHLPTLVIDKRAVTQVFLNLTTNAIKYHSPKVEFRLEVFSERTPASELEVTNAPPELLLRLKEMKIKEGFLITFRDHGIGVPRSFEERMFRPGNRANHPDVLSKSGAGLGLSVVRTIMRDHFGDVWLERGGRPTEIALFFPDILCSGAYQELTQWTGEAE